MSEELLERFEEAWQDGEPPSIDALLASAPGGDHRQLLEELVKIDLEYRWRRAPSGGEKDRPPLLETYSQHHPELGQPDELSVSLIGWEYLVRRRYGDHPNAEEYTTRFARHGEPLGAELARVDAQLAEEFASRLSRPAPSRGVRPPVRALEAGNGLLIAAPVESITSAATLLGWLSEYRLLTAAQLDELARDPFADARGLSRALLDRGWLTPYQLNQLFRGRGHELRLGPYLFLERIGEGGVGQVFKAHHEKLDRVVAIKVIRKELLTDAEVIGRFYREMEIVGRLSHPNIVQAYDAGPVGATHVLVMEYVEGTDLGRLVRGTGPLPVEQACEYIRQAALGLQHAHERGLIHRDVKPSNLLLAQAPGRSSVSFVKILDMGLARLQWTVHGDVTNLTTPLGAAVIGTPDYLAPEQAVNFHAADIRSDIYSLGCTLFYLLTGQPPFPGGTLTEKLLRHQQADPPPLERFRPDAPPALVGVLLQMLAKSPEWRPQTPAEVEAALRHAGDPILPALPLTILPSVNAARGIPVAVSRTGAPRPGRMLQRVLVAAVGVMAAGLLLFQLLPRWPTPPPAPRQTPAADLEALCAHLADPGINLDDAWARCQAFRRDHPRTAEEEQAIDLFRHYLFTLHARGPTTAQAVHARALLRQLPWPMDRLDGSHIPREDRPPQAPPEVVAVLGKRGRPPLGSIAVHPDGLFVAGGGFDHSVRLWDAGTGREVRSWEGLAGPVRALAFSPDGLTLAAGIADGSIKLWEVVGGKPLLDLTPKSRSGPVTHVEFAPDGKRLAAAGPKGPVRLWSFSPPKDRVLVHGLAGQSVHGLAYAPNGRLLAAAVQPGVIKLWRVPSGKLWPDLAVPHAHTVAFAPDSQVLAVGCPTGIGVRTYDTRDHRELRTYRSAQPTLGRSLAFTPDNRRLIAAGGRGSVIWWDASSTRELGRRTVTGEAWRDAALAPDGRHLVLAGGNGTAYVFRLAPAP